LVTSYVYNGFGELKIQNSPDTGTTTNTYDSGGNLATSTDARNAISAYSYDALNRVTSVEYKVGSTADQTISYTYDSGAFGKGRLTGAADANHSMSWTYDALARVTSKAQTVGSVTRTIGYVYANGRLTTLTLPSGNVVTYGYNSNGQVVSVAVGGVTILSGATYEPFGPVKGWTWGNGVTHTRSYDQEGRITAINSSHANAVNLAFSYDSAARITDQADSGSDPNSWTYGYDSMDRLTSAIGPTQTQGWTYDANGNRLTETGTQASTFVIDAASNRLSSTAGFLNRSYTYDAAGNALSYEDVSLAYNHRGRLISNTKGSSARSYVYNALGQLAKASGGAGGTVLYAYDEAGHLLGEYSSSGSLVQETIWLGDIPIATITGAGTPVIAYVHSDHLGTPVRVTRPSDNKRLWQWRTDPFGTLPVVDDPEGLGAFAYNLRLPGQLFDGHAGLHQNYFRDYSPAIGRYVESDPIGLLGGINTYLYASANPVGLIDVDGTNPATAARVGYAIGGATNAVLDAWLIRITGTSLGGLIYNACHDSERDKRRKNCQALKDSILNTCYGLTGRKRFACFQAAEDSFQQCMGNE
jgi:RHS repeat-associated protein